MVLPEVLRASRMKSAPGSWQNARSQRSSIGGPLPGVWASASSHIRHQLEDGPAHGSAASASFPGLVSGQYRDDVIPPPELLAEPRRPEPVDQLQQTPSLRRSAAFPDLCSYSIAASTTSTVTMASIKPINVFAMLPLDTVNADGAFRYASVPWFNQALHMLAASGAHGVAFDIWWGAVEREPSVYNWNGYKQLLEIIKQTGLRAQVVLSFHACGDNVGDTAQIPLPSWVLQCGEQDPDIFFTDRPRGNRLGQRNKEYISIWSDEAAGVLCGRSPLQCYTDFMESFRETFSQDLGSVIEEVVVGTGPCGELRYPSYVEANGWRFPGIGEFQCYDRRALASLAQAARDNGRPEWGYGGPHDAGNYNSTPETAPFFAHDGSWDTPYGRFFLDWYSGSLIKHGERLLATACQVLGSKLQQNRSSRISTSSEAGAVEPVLKSSKNGLPSEQQHQQPPQQQPLTISTTAGMGLPDASVTPVAVAPQRSNTNSTGLSETTEVEPLDMSTSIDVDMSLRADGGEPAARLSGPGGPLGEPGTTATMQFQYIGSSSTIAESIDCATSSCFRADYLCNSLGSLSTEFNAMIGAAGPFTVPFIDVNSLARDLGDDASECMTPDMVSEEGALLEDTSFGAAADRSTAAAGPLSAYNQEGLQGRDSLHLFNVGASAGHALNSSGIVQLSLKIAGVHWWYRTRSHAAELTAGYYNTATHDGYSAIVDLCSRYQVNITLTCVEMCDQQHPAVAMCGPEGLLKQIRGLAASRGISLSGENALPIFLLNGVDTVALDRIVYNTRAWQGACASVGHRAASGPYCATGFGGSGCGSSSFHHHAMSNILSVGGGIGRSMSDFHAVASRALSYVRSDPAIAATGLRGDSYADIMEPLPAIQSFTFLRLGPELLQSSYQAPWMRFMWRMQHAGFAPGC